MRSDTLIPQTRVLVAALLLTVLQPIDTSAQIREVGDLRAGLSPDGSGKYLVVATALAASDSNPVAMLWECNADTIRIVLLLSETEMRSFTGVGVQHGVLAPEVRTDRMQPLNVLRAGPTQLVILEPETFTQDALTHDRLSIGVHHETGSMIHEFRISGLQTLLREGRCGLKETGE